MTATARATWRRFPIAELKLALTNNCERAFPALVGEVKRQGHELVGVVDGHKLKLCLRPGRNYGTALDVTAPAGDRSPGRLGGNLLNLCIYKAGGDIRAGLELAARLVGLAVPAPGAAEYESAHAKQDRSAAASKASAEREAMSRRQRAERQYRAAVTGHPAVCAYFASRALGSVPEVARFSASQRHPDLQGMFPAILCPMIDPLTGEFRALHLTFIEKNADGGWRKANFAGGEPAKIMRGPKRGAVIRVIDPPGSQEKGELLIGEGVEDVMSAAGLFPGVPGWAAGDVGNLEAVNLLPWVGLVRPILQRDDGNEAVRVRRAAAFARWRAEGRVVQPWWPPRDCKDANELLAEIMRAVSAGEAGE